MNTDLLNKGVKSQSNEIRFLRLITIMLLVITLFCAYLAATADKSMKLEVNAPPTVVKDFWVSNKYFDENYLQQMGIFLSYMILNVTPTSLEFQLDLLKPYLSSDAYSREEVEINLKKKKYEKYQITTSFTPDRVFTPKNKSICKIEIEGHLSKKIGSKSLPEKAGKLMLDCININGRFYVTNISDNF